MSLVSLIVDPDAANRNRIKQAMMALPLFGKGNQAGSFADARSRLYDYSSIDVVFISDRFEKEEIRLFIEELKNNKISQDAAFVLIMRSKSNNMAEGILNGADGLLGEPYSVDTLQEITQLAERVKKHRERVRTEAGIQLLLKDLVVQVNNIASVVSGGLEPVRQVKKLEELMASILVLEPSLQARYLEMLIDVFEKAPPSARASLTQQYKGISNRVKGRLEKKLTTSTAN